MPNPTIPNYVDLDTIHRPSNGATAPASWGDQINDNDTAINEYLTGTATALSLFGVGNPAEINAGVRPAGAGPTFLLQSGSESYSPGTAGQNQNYSFPESFPNGVMAIVLTSMNYQQSYDVATISGTIFGVRGWLAGGTGATNGTFNWVAIGY